jgi:hypothetical protein
MPYLLLLIPYFCWRIPYVGFSTASRAGISGGCETKPARARTMRCGEDKDLEKAKVVFPI